MYTLHEPQINTTKHPSDQSFLLLAKSSNHILYNPSQESQIHQDVVYARQWNRVKSFRKQQNVVCHRAQWRGEIAQPQGPTVVEQSLELGPVGKRETMPRTNINFQPILSTRNLSSLIRVNQIRFRSDLTQKQLLKMASNKVLFFILGRLYKYVIIIQCHTIVS